MIEQSTIRTRGNCIYIGERLYGRVIENFFVKRDLLGDPAPALSSISWSSTSDIPAVSGDPVEDDVTSRSAILVSYPRSDSDKCFLPNKSSSEDTLTLSTEIEIPSVPPVNAPQHPQ